MKKLLLKILHKIFAPLINEYVRNDKNYNSIIEISTNLKTFIDNFNVIRTSNLSKKSKIYSPYRIVDSKIDDYTYVSENSKISKSSIGKFCSIGPNLLCGWGIHPTNALSTSPMFYSTMKQNGMTLSEVDKLEERKPIKIGNDVFIGANVTILDGIKVGDGAVIGAGAVVSKDIPPYAIAVGCPIQIIKFRFEEKQIEALLKIQWWNFPEERLRDIENYFFEVDKFIKKYSNA